MVKTNRGMAATAVFVRRAQSNQGDTEDAEKQVRDALQLKSQINKLIC